MRYPPNAMFCPACERVAAEVGAPAPASITCQVCGHEFVPDPFEQLTLRCEKVGLGRSPYYDRQGLPVPIGEWVRRLEAQGDYPLIAQDNVGNFLVSTVWLGMDHSLGGGPPLIFETMLLPARDGKPLPPGEWPEDDDGSDLSSGRIWRYSTEEDARAGHESVLARLRDKEVLNALEKEVLR